MNSTTPGTLISYRFSPGSCCISSCPTISLPVTTCPFNVNLSPFSQAFHSYRVFCLPPPPCPTADCQKNNFPFFTWLIVILQPFTVCQQVPLAGLTEGLSWSRCLKAPWPQPQHPAWAGGLKFTRESFSPSPIELFLSAPWLRKQNKIIFAQQGRIESCLIPSKLYQFKDQSWFWGTVESRALLRAGRV